MFIDIIQDNTNTENVSSCSFYHQVMCLLFAECEWHHLLCVLVEFVLLLLGLAVADFYVGSFAGMILQIT
jgi:hypothetical protein